MRIRDMEALAALYGMEINQTETGKGGLFYTDSEGIKKELNDVFDIYDDYTVPKCESISIKKCGMYSMYSEIAFLMSDAA